MFFILVALSGCSSKARQSENFIEPLQPKVVHSPKIVIDAGHGGKDLGAESLKSPKTQEKALTLSTAIMLNSILQKMGFQTILTRGEDFFVPLKLRADFANSNQATLFVSVHFNSAPNKEAAGVEVFYYDKDQNKERVARSKALGESVLKRVTANTGLKQRAVKPGDLAVIRETRMPAILIEGGFITNEKELKNLQNPEFLRKIAEGIALGIKDHLKS